MPKKPSIFGKSKKSKALRRKKIGVAKEVAAKAIVDTIVTTVLGPLGPLKTLGEFGQQITDASRGKSRKKKKTT